MENSDKLLYDLSSEVDNAPASPFISKTWLSVLDNNQGQYASSNVTIDTSQLSNSNKYCSYREAYLQVPLLITVSSNQVNGFAPATAATAASYSVGLKSFFGSLIHTLSVNYNGTQIIQAMPFQSVLNSFKLCTSLSWQDVRSQGTSLGFWPDDPTAFTYHLSAAPDLDGVGVCNSKNLASASAASYGVATNFNSYNGFVANEGFRKRQSAINWDADGGADASYSYFFTANNANTMYKSHVIRKINAVTGTTNGVYQVAVSATIMLRHLSSLFNNLPLVKGAFITMQLQLNNSTTVVQKSAFVAAVVGPPAVAQINAATTLVSVNSAVGGINPLMIASMQPGSGGQAFNATPTNAVTITASVSIGSRCLEPTQLAIAGVTTGAIGNSITLNLPTYVLSPVFEQAYLSNPIRSVPFSDFYFYQLTAQAPGATINALLSNGIANLQRITIFPVLSASSAASTQLPAGTPVYSSPFDPALTSGFGSPLLHISQFQIQVAGSNVLANAQRYTYEQWLHEIGSCGSVNGGLTDGVSSGLLSKEGWEMAPVYTCDLSRMLPAERSIPKSVVLQGINISAMTVDYMCFIEFAQEGLKIDVLSGAKV